MVIDKNWTLFIDRDGVINERLIDDYVKIWEDFRFIDGVLDALKSFSEKLNRILIITNQQGIGKGLMTIADLELIHKRMLERIQEYGGRVDKVYFCPDLANKPENCRKPANKMALWAKDDFPEIDFNRSIMIGDSSSDIDFGKSMGMKTVYINSDGRTDPEADYSFKSLPEFADFMN